WDSSNANERALTLTNQVETLKGRLENGLEKEAKGHLKDFFVIKDENENLKVEINYENLQKAVDSKGFSAIASSMEMDAATIRQIYYLRDNSEKGFSFLKPQLGYDSARVHSDESVKGKFAVGFVSTILRTYFEAACKKFGLATNFAIRELNSIVLHMGRDNLYEAIHNASGKTLQLLKSFGVRPATLEALAVEVNSGARLKDEQRKMPVELAALVVREGPGRPRKIKTEPEPPKRPRGRPKGSKNKKTLEKEALMASLPPVIKRKPGRPKGSKNKKTLEREALLAKPKRGRPKGSKNKTPEEKAALMAAPKRPRGRPRKNKVAESAAMQNPQSLSTNTELEKTVGINPTVSSLQSNVDNKAELDSTAGIKPDKDTVGNPTDTS
ncbi:MAG: hypothetical protein LUC43_02125, partial [Burkholderiales bacterium]|nr:hypothetical protein [Burkholderiales bacterium]